MEVDVTANFIAPLAEFSSRELSFTSHQVKTYVLNHVTIVVTAEQWLLSKCVLSNIAV